MSHLIPFNFPGIFDNTIQKHGNRPALANVGETPITYLQLSGKIDALIAFFETAGIAPGDKVAILSTNMPNWVVTYYAVTFMGAVAVPILPDSQTPEIEKILNHSETKAIFACQALIGKIEGIKTDYLKYLIRMENFSVVEPENDLLYQPDRKPVKDYEVKDDDLAAIIYTSGTTGRPKGVMLTHRNISFNARKGGVIQPINEHDRFLSILPLAHTYENTLGMILPMLNGACVYYLGKTPSPSVLLPAMKEVKPTLMLTVPLIIEKVFFNRIEPKFRSSFIMKHLYSYPAIRKKLHKIAGNKLYETFGGHLKFFGIGGSKLNPKVEQFLIDAKFPYAIGYGLTETSPLLAGVNPSKVRLESTGPAIEETELIIHEPDVNGQGEIWAKGPGVMKGYYKDPEQTALVLSEDGWFRTGDIGRFDSDGFLYIKGRIKNIILGSTGQNIYPEDIESVINNFRHVVDSIVVEQKGKLVAFVHFNRDEIEQRYAHLKNNVQNYVEKVIETHKKELEKYVNSKVNKHSQIHNIIIQSDPFQKTATQKIKRFMYTGNS